MIFGIAFLVCGFLLFIPGAQRLGTVRRCRIVTAGRYLDRESVASFRGEKFKLIFEYEYEGKLYTSRSDGKFTEKEILNRGFTRGRRYEILISPGDPKLCTCRMKNEYVFEATFCLMAAVFAAAAGAMLLI